jgi:hypothetical protein
MQNYRYWFQHNASSIRGITCDGRQQQLKPSAENPQGLEAAKPRLGANKPEAATSFQVTINTRIV